MYYLGSSLWNNAARSDGQNSRTQVFFRKPSAHYAKFQTKSTLAQKQRLFCMIKFTHFHSWAPHAEHVRTAAAADYLGNLSSQFVFRTDHFSTVYHPRRTAYLTVKFMRCGRFCGVSRWSRSNRAYSFSSTIKRATVYRKASVMCPSTPATPVYLHVPPTSVVSFTRT